jgi:ABC-type uncharacterized transport system auxiliary subunit
MSQDSNEMLHDRLMAKRESITDSDTDIRSMDVLSIDYEVTQDLRVTEVTLTLSYGGPTIYLDCLSGQLRGHWSFSSDTVPLDDDDVQAYGESLALSFEDRIQS